MTLIVLIFMHISSYVQDCRFYDVRTLEFGAKNCQPHILARLWEATWSSSTLALGKYRHQSKKAMILAESVKSAKCQMQHWSGWRNNSHISMRFETIWSPVIDYICGTNAFNSALDNKNQTTAIVECA